jgi:hypothetical protein
MAVSPTYDAHRSAADKLVAEFDAHRRQTTSLNRESTLAKIARQRALRLAKEKESKGAAEFDRLLRYGIALNRASVLAKIAPQRALLLRKRHGGDAMTVVMADGAPATTY